MKQALFRSALIGACLALLAGSAVAKDHGRDRDRDDRGRARFEHRNDRDRWRGDRDRRFRYVDDRSRERDRERARARWREREREREHARIAAERSRRPPGWSKGKKTGWGDCDVPPGQAKKVGCQPDRHAGYPRRDGRRPVIVTRTPTTTTRPVIAGGHTSPKTTTPTREEAQKAVNKAMHKPQ